MSFDFDSPSEPSASPAHHTPSFGVHGNNGWLPVVRGFSEPNCVFHFQDSDEEEAHIGAWTATYVKGAGRTTSQMKRGKTSSDSDRRCCPPPGRCGWCRARAGRGTAGGRFPGPGRTRISRENCTYGEQGAGRRLYRRRVSEDIFALFICGVVVLRLA